MSLLDLWNKRKFSIYDSEEKSTLELMEKLSRFIKEEVIKEVDNKVTQGGDFLGTWQGIAFPTLSEEGLRGTVEGLQMDVTTLKNNDKNKILNVLDYGIDNKGTIDQYQVIQNLLNEKSREGIQRFYFPKGTYLLSNTITLPSGVVIEGDGTYKTIFKMSNVSSASSVFNLPSDSYLNELINFTVDGGNITNIIGILLNDTTNTVIDEIIKVNGVYIINCSIGVKVGDNNRGNYFNNVMVDLCKDGFIINGTDNIFNQCIVRSCIGDGYIFNGSNNQVSNIKAFYCDKTGVTLNGNNSIMVNVESQENGTNGIVVNSFNNTLHNIMVDTNGRVNNKSSNLYIKGWKNIISGVCRLNTTLEGQPKQHVYIEKEATLNNINLVIHGNITYLSGDGLAPSNNVIINGKVLKNNFVGTFNYSSALSEGVANKKYDFIYDRYGVSGSNLNYLGGGLYSQTISLPIGAKEFIFNFGADIIKGGSKCWIKFYNDGTFISEFSTEEINENVGKDGFTTLLNTVPSNANKVTIECKIYAINEGVTDGYINFIGINFV